MTQQLTQAEIVEYIRKNATTGVGYYNKDNKDKEDKKDKILGRNNPFLTSSSGLEATPLKVNSCSMLSSSEGQQGEEEPLDSGALGSEIEEMKILSDMKTAIIQLYDNGEQSKQRYKLKTRINLKDGENPEFIANLTKDLRNFKKYIPEEGKTEVLEFATHFRKEIKTQFGSYPYLGKFHFNTGGQGSRTIEPNTVVAVWYDSDNKGWSGALMIYDWILKFDLFNEYLSDKQKQAGVKCQTTWTHPDHQKARPKTWAQQRAEKK